MHLRFSGEIEGGSSFEWFHSVGHLFQPLILNYIKTHLQVLSKEKKLLNYKPEQTRIRRKCFWEWKNSTIVKNNSISGKPVFVLPKIQRLGWKPDMTRMCCLQRWSFNYMTHLWCSLKIFFFLSFHLFPLLFNKLNVISDWVYSFLFGCCWISLQRNCTCWSFDQITPALFFMLHFAPLVNSNRARNEREWKIYRPHHIDLVSI